MRRCDLCEFWEDPEDITGSSDPDDLQGTCRRNAPAPWNSSLMDVFDQANLLGELIEKLIGLLHLDDISLPDRLTADDASTYYCWPKTLGHDWCGEFNKRSEPSE